MITMTSVGYGDFYAQSHCGRLIAIFAALWGTLNMSLFVVALNNILNLDSSESKAYMLMERLEYKDKLRVEAVGALAAGYKIKLLKKKPKIDPFALKMAQRAYNNHMEEFRTLNRQIRNISDKEADMETLKNGMENLLDDFEIML